MVSVHSLLSALKSPDSVTRNEAAIALMDLQDDMAIEPLIEAIENPEHRTARGTLIYALSGFSCEDRFDQLFRWALEGGYEATGEALSIIYEQNIRPDRETLMRCEALLVQARASGEVEPEIILELTELLSPNGG